MARSKNLIRKGEASQGDVKKDRTRRKRKLEEETADETSSSHETTRPTKKPRQTKDKGEQAKTPKAKKKQFLMLSGGNWIKGKTDVQGWLMSEKYDGVRAYVPACRNRTTVRRIMSRNGQDFYPPEGFLDCLPRNMDFDGELWIGPKQFDKVSGILRSRTTQSEGWKDVKFLVFDSPNTKGPFETRLEKLKEALASCASPEHRGRIKLVEQVPVQSDDHIQEHFDRIVKENDGEGIMLKKNGSMYTCGRTKELLKFKPFNEGEGVVVGYTRMKVARATEEEKGGKNKSKFIGAIKVKSGDVTFHVGSGLDEETRRTPPAKGAVICYTYQEETKNGVPRFPVYKGVRSDVSEE